MLINEYENISGVLIAKGLSTDTKPQGPPNGAIFMELDTGLSYTASGGNWAVSNNNVANNAMAAAIAANSNATNALANTGYAFVGVLAADQATGANVTPVTLIGLVFSYQANSRYRIWFMGNVQPGAATTGCGFQFDLSSVVTSISILFNHPLANTGTLTGGYSIADDASAGASSGMPATGAYPVRGEGIIVTGANTGTAQLRFRSETTAVTTCKAGFVLIVEKL